MSGNDRRSAEAASYRRLYKGQRWASLRQHILVRDLYTCQRCSVMLSGRHPAPNSPTVNHRKPHKGDLALFYDEANLEAVCKGCHDLTIQQTEVRGYSSGVDSNGFPTDPMHPWNR